CYLCERPLSGELERDHVIPVARGGPNNASNLRLVHKVCNRGKRDNLPIPQVGESYHLPLRARPKGRPARMSVDSDGRFALWMLRSRHRMPRRVYWSAIQVIEKTTGIWISKRKWKDLSDHNSKNVKFVVPLLMEKGLSRDGAL